MDELTDGRIVRARLAVPLGRGSPRATEGRVCVEPGCGTRLSAYNSAAACWVHQEEYDRRRRLQLLGADRAPELLEGRVSTG